MKSELHIVFDGAEGPLSLRFVEVEDEAGRSVSVGEWTERPGGRWALRIPDHRALEARVRELEAALTFSQLREVNIARCNEAFGPHDDWTPTDWMTAVAGEVGEAANLIKKLRRGEAIDHAEIGKELADSVIYLDLLAARLGINLGEAVARKFDEVSDRRDWKGPRLADGIAAAGKEVDGE